MHLSLAEYRQLIRACLASRWFHLDGIKPHISPGPQRFNRREGSTTVPKQNQTMTSLGLSRRMRKSDVTSNLDSASFLYIHTYIYTNMTLT